MCISNMSEERWCFYFNEPLLHAGFKLKVVHRWDNTSCQVRTEFSGVHFQFIPEHSTQSFLSHSPPSPMLPLVFGSSFASFFCPFEMLIQTVIPLLLTRFTSLFKTRRWSLRDIRHALLNACEQTCHQGLMNDTPAYLLELIIPTMKQWAVQSWWRSLCRNLCFMN